MAGAAGLLAWRSTYALQASVCPKCLETQGLGTFSRMRSRRVLVLRLGSWGRGVDAKSVRKVGKRPQALASAPTSLCRVLVSSSCHVFGSSRVYVFVSCPCVVLVSCPRVAFACHVFVSYRVFVFVSCPCVVSSCRIFVSYLHVASSFPILLSCFVFVSCSCVVSLFRAFVFVSSPRVVSLCLRLRVASSCRVLVSCPRVVSSHRIFLAKVDDTCLHSGSWILLKEFGFRVCC